MKRRINAVQPLVDFANKAGVQIDTSEPIIDKWWVLSTRQRTITPDVLTKLAKHPQFAWLQVRASDDDRPWIDLIFNKVVAKKHRDRKRYYCGCFHSDAWWATRNPDFGSKLPINFKLIPSNTCKLCGYVPWRFENKQDTVEWKRRLKYIDKTASQLGLL